MNLETRPLSDEELASRFLLQSSWIRENETVRPEAFVPPPNLELSVTCRFDLSEDRIWNIGRQVAIKSSRSLYGRADVKNASVKKQNLSLELDPTPENPNHANVKGWPKDKPSQKMIAIELAASSQYFSAPSSRS